MTMAQFHLNLYFGKAGYMIYSILAFNTFWENLIIVKEKWITIVIIMLCIKIHIIRATVSVLHTAKFKATIWQGIKKSNQITKILWENILAPWCSLILSLFQVSCAHLFLITSLSVLLSFIDLIWFIGNLGGFINGWFLKQKCLDVMEISIFGWESQHNSSFLSLSYFLHWAHPFTPPNPENMQQVSSILTVRISYVNNHPHRLLCHFFYNFSRQTVCGFSLYRY